MSVLTRPGDADGWNGLALVVGERHVLLAAEAAAIVAATLERYSRTEGVRLSPAVDHVRRVCARVASQAAVGQTDVRRTEQSPLSEDWISTTQAAELLGIGMRHCTRLVGAEAFGEARKVKGRWWIRRDEVAAFAAERRAS